MQSRGGVLGSTLPLLLSWNPQHLQEPPKTLRKLPKTSLLLRIAVEMLVQVDVECAHAEHADAMPHAVGGARSQDADATFGGGPR